VGDVQSELEALRRIAARGRGLVSDPQVKRVADDLCLFKPDILARALKRTDGTFSAKAVVTLAMMVESELLELVPDVLQMQDGRSMQAQTRAALGYALVALRDEDTARTVIRDTTKCDPEPIINEVMARFSLVPPERALALREFSEMYAAAWSGAWGGYGGNNDTITNALRATARSFGITIKETP
jgi:hypothetical protein